VWLYWAASSRGTVSVAGRSTRSLGVMDNKLRWLALGPGVVAAWFLALFTAMFVRSTGAYLCPPELFVSGFCDVPWWSTWERASGAFGAGLAAVLVVVTATLIAPSNKRRVAWLSFAFGAVVAVAIGFAFLVELAAALVAGAIAALFMARTAKHDA
jgi:hypothetical protein